MRLLKCTDPQCSCPIFLFERLGLKVLASRGSHHIGFTVRKLQKPRETASSVSRRLSWPGSPLLAALAAGSRTGLADVLSATANRDSAYRRKIRTNTG